MVTPKMNTILQVILTGHGKIIIGKAPCPIYTVVAFVVLDLF